MKKHILIAMVVMGASFIARAEDQKTTATEQGNVLKTNVGNDKAPKDIDDEITNARMRATLGSKSRWSFKSALGYSGGSIEKPMANVRPNYRAGATREALPGLAGTIGINYRMTERDNLSFGTGLNIVDPFHGNLSQPAVDGRKGANFGKEMKRYEVSTPNVDWSRGYKAFGAQMITDISGSYYTDSDSKDANAIGDIALSQTILGDVPHTNWQVGVSGTFDYSIYGGNVASNVEEDYASGAVKRDDMLLALYPFAEYQFNDKFSFRTVFGYFEFSNYKNEYGNNTDFRQKEPYQSMGVGISVTRDIYVYPNIQFAPKDVRADRTNVALSTNINI